MPVVHKDTGIIERTVPKKTLEEELVEWIIPDFSTVYESTETCYDSPTFIVNGVSWLLRLYPTHESNSEFMRVYLLTYENREYALEYNYSLIKSDGSAEQWASGIVQGNYLCSSHHDLIKRSEILQRKSELTPQDVFTLICRLKYEITQPIASDKTETLKLIRLDKLSDSFKALFDDKETCDTTLKVKDKEYKAHRTVLIARSSVFAATFKHDTLERQTGVITISDCDPDSFQEFLEYLYCGRLDDLSSHIALNLYYTSDKYGVEELKTFCIENLMQMLTVGNVCEVAVFAEKYDETELSSAVQDFFSTNVCEILDTSGWDDLLTQNRRLANKLLKEMSRAK